MKKDHILPLLMIVATVVGCAGSHTVNENVAPSAPVNNQNRVEVPAKTAGPFSPDDACTFPSKASDPRMRSLAGGRWEEIVAEGQSMGYACRNGRSSQREVKLFTDGSFGVQIEYAVIGVEEGAEYLAIDYWVDISLDVPNEPKFREDYVKFIQDLTKTSLKAELPAEFRTKIRDLGSYSSSGKSNEFTKNVGAGRLVMSRNKGPDGGMIMVKTLIYPSVDDKKGN